MSFDSIVARCSRERAAGIRRVYPQHNQATRAATLRTTLPMLECQHGGTDADILERCPSCSGGGRHVRECALHGTCTHEPVNPAVMDCRKCRAEGLGYAPVTPPRVAPDNSTLVDFAAVDRDERRRFNASVLDYGGSRWLAYRVGWTRSHIHLARLGADAQPVETQAIHVPHHPGCELGQEDPRLFVFDGAMHLAFAGLRWHGGRLVVSQMLARLNGVFAQRVWEPSLPNRQMPMEKNWGFFNAENQLFAVYTIRPHRVLSIDPEHGQAIEAFRTDSIPAQFWPGWELRGGAPPVRYGNEYYSFFHGWRRSKRAGTPHGDWYDYAVGVYTFEARPPFTPRRITPRPIWLGDPAKIALNVTPDKNVIYPCGAIRDGERWLVSAGHQDAECRLRWFGLGEIEDALEPIDGQ